MPPITGKLQSDLPPKLKSEGWEDKNVTLSLIGKPPQKTVRAWVLGELWLYRSLEPRDTSTYSVTHAKTSCLMCLVKTREDGVRVCRTLRSEVPFALSFDDPQDVVNNLPKWVKPWLIKVTKEGTYASPSVGRGVQRPEGQDQGE